MFVTNLLNVIYGNGRLLPKKIMG